MGRHTCKIGFGNNSKNYSEPKNGDTDTRTAIRFTIVTKVATPSSTTRRQLSKFTSLRQDRLSLVRRRSPTSRNIKLPLPHILKQRLHSRRLVHTRGHFVNEVKSSRGLLSELVTVTESNYKK